MKSISAQHIFFSKILTEVVKRVWMIMFLFGNCVLNCDEKRKRRKYPIYIVCTKITISTIWKEYHGEEG